MPTRDDATHIVDNKQMFIDGVETDEAVVYIDDSFKCNIWKPLDVGDNITIVSGYCDPDRTENGGRGPVVHFDYFTKHAIKTRSSITLYGVSFRGPEGEYFDPYERADKHPTIDDPRAWDACGVWAFPDRDGQTIRIIGSEFYDWTHAGVLLGAKNYEPDVLIHRCSFHDCMMESLGYGVSQYDGTLTITDSFFDTCRHCVAGFGYPSEELIMNNCVTGPGDHSSHVIDRHCLANMFNNGDRTAGKFSHLYRISALSHEPGEPIQDVLGYDQEFFAIRGASVEESYLDKIDFWAPEAPTPTGENGDAFRQESEWHENGDEWIRLDIRDVAYGGENGPEYGAALASDDTRGGHADPEYDNLRVIGYGTAPTDYRFTVTGDAHERDLADSSETVVTQGDTSTISGYVVGGIDAFAIPVESDITEAWIAGTARVERNGQPVDLTSATTAAIDRRLDTHSQRLAALEENWQQLKEAFIE